VLTELKYIEGEKTLPQGGILAKIYTESDLLLTEAIREDLFDHLSASELLSVVSSVVFQGRASQNQAPRIPTGNVQTALGEIIRLWAKLEVIEKAHSVTTQREPDFGFCWISFRWANGHSLQSVLKDSDLSVGDFVRSTKQLIDLLQQISVASEKLRPKCLEAIKKLDRGVVAYFAGEA
jgi:ATP-dependent RNA helicase HelY